MTMMMTLGADDVYVYVYIDMDCINSYIHWIIMNRKKIITFLGSSWQYWCIKCVGVGMLLLFSIVYTLINELISNQWMNATNEWWEGGRCTIYSMSIPAIRTHKQQAQFTPSSPHRYILMRQHYTIKTSTRGFLWCTEPCDLNFLYPNIYISPELSIDLYEYSRILPWQEFDFGASPLFPSLQLFQHTTRRERERRISRSDEHDYIIYMIILYSYYPFHSCILCMNWSRHCVSIIIFPSFIIFHYQKQLWS